MQMYSKILNTSFYEKNQVKTDLFNLNIIKCFCNTKHFLLNFILCLQILTHLILIREKDSNAYIKSLLLQYENNKNILSHF